MGREITAFSNPWITNEHNTVTDERGEEVVKLPYHVDEVPYQGR
jgi:hypothetical protein